MHVLAGAIMEYMVNGRILGRNGNRLAHAAPHGVYPCSGEDKWAAIAVLSEEDWKNFCRVIENPQWTTTEKFSSLTQRKKNEDELDELVGAWTRQRSAEEVETLMQQGGVAANVVETGEDIYKDPQLAHYGHFREIDHPNIGKVNTEIPPSSFKKQGCPYPGAVAWGAKPLCTFRVVGHE